MPHTPPHEGPTPITVHVPACSSEEHTWVADNDGMRSRRQMARSSGVYSSCVPARIADLELSIPTSLAADLAHAEAELAAFDAFTLTSLGQHTRSLGPFSAVLLRTEASSSSQIENLTVGARQLALAQVEQATSMNAHLVMNNVRAMEHASRVGSDISVRTLTDMHRALLDGHPDAGKLRDQLVWVGTSAITPLGAAHVAPQPELVVDALDDLITFMQRNDWPLIAQVAVAHAQFETIHPFTDGNGRTGRALVHLMLTHAGLMRVTAPISAGFLRDTDTYFRALTAFRRGDAGPIITLFVHACLLAARAGRQLVNDLTEWKTDAIGRAREAGAPPVALQIIDIAVSHPALTSAVAADLLGIHPNTAIRALTALERCGVLRETTGLRRGRVWVTPEVIALQDDFAPTYRRG